MMRGRVQAGAASILATGVDALVLVLALRPPAAGLFPMACHNSMFDMSDMLDMEQAHKLVEQSEGSRRAGGARIEKRGPPRSSRRDHHGARARPSCPPSP